MTHSDLILRIRDIIRTITKKEFVRPIHVRDLEPEGYEVGIEFRQYDPVYYSAQLPDDLFIKFICHELRKSKALRTECAKAERNTPNHIHNDFLSPYDTTRLNGKNR